MAKRCLDRRGQNILRDGWMMTHHTRRLFAKFVSLYTYEDIQRIAAKMDKENARD